MAIILSCSTSIYILSPLSSWFLDFPFIGSYEELTIVTVRSNIQVFGETFTFGAF